MALNIPNVNPAINTLLGGVDTGSSMFARMMQPIIAREKLKQQQQESAEFNPLRKQIMQQQLLGLQHGNDPTYDLKKFQALMNGTMPSGDQLLQNSAGNQTGSPNANSNPTVDALKQNPLLRGFFKKQFGFDPLNEDSLHGPARDALDLEKLKNEVGENSDVYKNAKSSFDAQLQAKQDLRDIRARTKAGLKPGEKEFFDEKTGAPLGKEIPLTATERQSEEGNILFNELYPYVYKGASPFSGEGSIKRLQQAAANYKTDPKARQLFDDYQLAEKMLGATVVNEASTLKAGRQNRTYSMLKESLEAQDIPRIVKKLIKEYEIPASSQLRAAMRYQKALSDARKKARKGTPATQRLYYDPEKQSEHEAAKEEVMQPKDAKVINGVTYYPDGQGGWEHD